MRFLRAGYPQVGPFYSGGGWGSLPMARTYAHQRACTSTEPRAIGASTDPILAACWFWLAQYGPTPVVPRNWKTWTIWQYTDGALGPKPHTVKGIGRCDRDKFNGSEAQLRKLWAGVGQGRAAAMSQHVRM